MSSSDPKKDIYNVTRLNREVRAVLEGSFPTLWVQGEISNLASPASGHLYFSLKDASSQVRCAMFRGNNRHLGFNPVNGDEVLLRAVVGMYEARGEFQLIVEYMEPAGAGALQRAFEELKMKLLAEGLFDLSHKKPVPEIVETIGIITSPTGAAIRDILIVLHRRYPLANIIIYPVSVQGDGAVEQIINMLAVANCRAECDVIILARGGGSLEDLQAFNNEQVARSIFKSQIPVITGIGHEIDTTIADFVADQRAATPSAAAELVSPDQNRLLSNIIQSRTRLVTLTRQVIQFYGLRTAQLEKRLPDPARTLQMVAQRLDELGLRRLRAISSTQRQKLARLNHIQDLLINKNPADNISRQSDHCTRSQNALIQSMRSYLQQSSEKVRQLAHNLDTVSPLATLARGYSIVQTNEGEIVRRANQINTGEKLKALFGRGSADVIVKKINDD